MLYTEKEKNEIERVRKVFEKHIQQITAYDLVWSDKIDYVWLAISIDPVYIDTGNWIESAAGLCYECLNDIALDVFGMTGNDHDFEDADPLELAEIKRRWKPYIGQLPEYAYLCDELLSTHLHRDLRQSAFRRSGGGHLWTPGQCLNHHRW